MSKEIYISSTPHETRLAIVEDDNLAEIYYERENEYTLAGSIYNGKVTRVLPGMQSSFVDIGLERDAFLYITDFMEETEEDTADFDASAAPAGGDRSPDRGRAPRNENGQGRGDRGGREQGGRDRGALPRSTEPTDAELFTSAVSGLDPARPVIEGERVERGERDRGRRGGRNRGNRGGNRVEGERVGGNRVEEPQGAELRNSEPVAGNISIPDNPEEVGEGLPGADGSRRWRGRRGRRGNRGNGSPRPEAAPPAGAEEVTPRAATAPVYGAYDAPDEPAEENFNIVAAAETLPTTSEQAAFRERSERNDRGPRQESGGRDRGGRDRNDRDRNDRGGRDLGRGDRGPGVPPRVPRGFAPSTDLYKVDKGETRYGAEPELEQAPSEPIILSGESLSKYRKGEDGQVVKQAEAAPAAAPVDTFVAQGWDGGFVLPGETLRRRENPPAYRNDAPAARGDAGGRDAGRFGERDRGARDRGGRDRGGDRDRGRRESRPEFVPIAEQKPESVTEPVVTQYPAATGHPAVTEKAETSVPTYLTEPESVPSSHLITPLNSTFVPPPPMPVEGATVEAAPVESAPVAIAPVAAAPSEPEVVHAVEVPQEYEPEEASASYRIDPVPPSEFRVASPSPEEQAAGEDEDSSYRNRSTPGVYVTEEDGTVVEESPETHEVAAFVPAVEVPSELVHETHQHEAVSHEEVPAEAHELTSISATGEMHSESAATSAYELPLEEVQEPSSPIEHQHAVVEGEVAPAEPVRAAQPYFEPGSGLLEEEMMDEDEDGDTLPTLHAHTSAEFDQQEHETLEGAADLGTMIREMSIDQITRPEPVLDEDDEDFEEDQLEEDHDFAESDEDDEEEDEAGDDAGYGEAEGGEEGADLGEPGGRFADAESESHAPAAAAVEGVREPRREGGRREGRREGRRGDRGRRPGSGERSGSDRTSERTPDRTPDRGHERSGGGDHGRRDGHRGRQSMQSTNLPAISDLLKPGQEILVQIAKEPIAKKGARITSHIALPGRFLVFMPTVSHTGVSRKIESDSERRRLKEILLSERGDAQGGFIVRTAASGASEEELRSDLRFLLNLWADIKQRSESSKSPALIYHDLNLIERVLRDQVTDNFSAIWVDTETEYERVLRFLQRFQPSLIRRVKLYTKETPLFEQFGITEEINKALRSKVWLKSGGSIVINQTEALVAIDINTGKFVGKTARLEDTIVKTNLDAIPEIVRQIRLRDLGGIIIIDFIDMDERKNRNKVMAALEEELKLDRAPSKVLQFNDFGLVAITRKRVKQSLERTLSTTCGVCAGTGMVKSPVTVCNDIYVEMRKMAKHLDRGDVMLRVHPEVVKQLKAPSTHWLQEMEEMVGKTILVKSDPALHPEQFDIH